MNPEHMEGRILSTYAGGCAQRRVKPDEGSDGCETDENIAADLLQCWGWEGKEQALRDRAAALVEQHWNEIVAVADALRQHDTLDDTEVELIADAAGGCAEFVYGSLEADLAQYRALRSAAR